MPIYKPSELGKYLNELGIGPKKGLSQNFLLDGNIINKIVALSNLTSEDVVLEIGPGPGALTEALLKTGAKVIAVEKDDVLAKGLERLKVEGNLEVYCDDILKFPAEEKLSTLGKKVKIIANLPYHLTTPIITRLIPRSDLFSEIIVMVQEEVAQRFVANPGSKEYGSITVFLNFYSKPKYGFKVSHNCFFPKPKVDSAVVKFTLHGAPIGINEEEFFQLTRTSFGQRRKMLSSTLRGLYPVEKIQLILSEIKNSSKCRPEELSLDEFIELYKRLKQD
jgi:16S rRNA (adenine1518-N6/adenine1519-N6)-dimethyltransferase